MNNQHLNSKEEVTEPGEGYATIRIQSVNELLPGDRVCRRIMISSARIIGQDEERSATWAGTYNEADLQQKLDNGAKVERPLPSPTEEVEQVEYEELIITEPEGNLIPGDRIGRFTFIQSGSSEIWFVIQEDGVALPRPEVTINFMRGLLAGHPVRRPKNPLPAAPWMGAYKDWATEVNTADQLAFAAGYEAGQAKEGDKNA